MAETRKIEWKCFTCHDATNPKAPRPMHDKESAEFHRMMMYGHDVRPMEVTQHQAEISR